MKAISKAINLGLASLILFTLLTSCSEPRSQSDTLAGTQNHDDAWEENTIEDNAQASRQNWEIEIPSVGRTYFEDSNGVFAIEKMMDGTRYADYDFREIDDGLVNLYMTQDFYDAFIYKTRTSVMLSFSSLVKGEGSEYVTGIENNSDYTEVIILVDTSVYAKLDADYIPPVVGLISCFYQVFTPNGITGCHVIVRDDTNGLNLGDFTFPSDANPEQPQTN